MNFIEKVTGSDITKAFRDYDLRVKKLPDDYQMAWEQIQSNIWTHSDFTGRNLIPILDGVLDLFEETAADSLPVYEVLGSDIKAFCFALAGEDGALSYRDRWRKQLNHNVAKKLDKLLGE